MAIVSRTASGVNLVRYVREGHLGGVAGIENSDGTSYVKESFTAYGARRSSCTWSGSPTSGQLTLMAAATRHGYTWHTALGTMGLNDMNGRIEDAQIGRCLSADPYVTDQTNTQEFNRYSYVVNNPLTLTDPSGFDDNNCASEATGGMCQGVGPSGIQSGPPPMETVPIVGSRLTYPGIQINTLTPADLAAMGVSGHAGSFGGMGGAAGSDGWHPPLLPPSKPSDSQDSNQEQEVMVNGKRPQTRPNPTQCPRGAMAAVGNVFVNGGSDAMQVGAGFAVTGLAGVETGTAATAMGAPEIGGPFIAGGTFMISAGGWIELAGLTARGIGGVLLAIGGNSQPLQSAAVSLAANRLNKNTQNLTGLPEGTPNPYDAAAEKISGENPCP